MFPMTPMASWSFILLIVAVIVLLAWGLLGSEAAPEVDQPGDDPVDAGDDITVFADLANTSVQAPSRPRLRLIHGGLDDRLTARRESRLYDWARDGL